jgi:hypothetical protein
MQHKNIMLLSRVAVVHVKRTWLPGHLQGQAVSCTCPTTSARSCSCTRHTASPEEAQPLGGACSPNTVAALGLYRVTANAIKRAHKRGAQPGQGSPGVSAVLR